MAWLSVWSEMQTCIWLLSWCHCHSLSLAPVKSRLVIFCYRLTWVVPEKGPLNEWWGNGMVICLERDADLHMAAQLMPLPLTVSCSSKIQIGHLLLPANLGSPGKRAVKWVCVCVCISEKGDKLGCFQTFELRDFLILVFCMYNNNNNKRICIAP